MKRSFIILLLLTTILLLYNLHAIFDDQSKDQQLVRGMKANKKEPEQAPLLGSIEASDGTILAYSCYVPEKPQASLIFYHGSGVNGQAGYTYMAEQLSRQYNVATYLFDIRGHGRSSGPRGDTPHSTTIWSDVCNALHYVQQKHKDVPLFLGGHSGGAGLLLNYAVWNESVQPDGYLFVAPMLGRDAGVVRDREKKSDRPFVELHHFALLMHYVTGGLIGGHWQAVTFNYPEHLIKERGFVTAYTINMLGAMHPHHVQQRLSSLQVPTWIFVADQDELFDPEKIDRFLEPVLESNNYVYVAHLPDAYHLTILGEVHDQLGQAVQQKIYT
jgi:alpha-beta hydrolase superfamily lysophospholipase